ncbi:MAG: N-acetylmuramoyl-L-alanine amidase [Desulfobacteraceae bacterium]|nr:N-acetylmuramoyl-L-alanine amidase [Desulfobacteraceae bacterium]
MIKTNRFLVFFIFIYFIILANSFTICYAGEPIDKALKTVVIDPGHGGRDIGAKGPQGSLEKDVCLELAQHIFSYLKSEYNVILTRSADYAVEIRDRAAIANHYKADAFISLHTGGSFQHSASRIVIYTCKPGSGQTAPADPNSPRVMWNQLHSRSAMLSRGFAELMKKAISDIGGAPPKIRKAPLRVLQGASMPSILIETGHLTHLDTENTLASQDRLRAYARAIANGLESFLAIDTGANFSSAKGIGAKK